MTIIQYSTWDMSWSKCDLQAIDLVVGSHDVKVSHIPLCILDSPFGAVMSAIGSRRTEIRNHDNDRLGTKGSDSTSFACRRSLANGQNHTLSTTVS